eukprot:scaffold7377_cov389-Prasinococcus_capsulatus_cf.AAC.15
MSGTKMRRTKAPRVSRLSLSLSLCVCVSGFVCAHEVTRVPSHGWRLSGAKTTDTPRSIVPLSSLLRQGSNPWMPCGPGPSVVAASAMRCDCRVTLCDSGSCYATMMSCVGRAAPIAISPALAARFPVVCSGCEA